MGFSTTACCGEPFEAAFAESIALFAAIKERFELARTWAAYAAALAEHGDKIAAHTYFQQARDTFAAIGANGELRRLAAAVKDL